MRRSTIYLLVIVTLFVIVLLLRFNYHKLEKNYDSFITSTESRLDDQMLKMEADEEVVLSYLLENPEFSFEALNQLETNFPFFIYKSDKLVFWNDDVVLPNVKFDKNDRWQFYNKSSGEFLFLTSSSNTSEVTLLFVNTLYTNYSISNEYISSFYNQEIFSQKNIQLFADKKNGSYSIDDIGGSYLFSITLKEDFINHKTSLHLIILSTEFLLLIFLLYVLWTFCCNILNKHKHLSLFYLFGGLIIVRLGMWFLDFPFQSEEIVLFDPKFFASSFLNPSFGALLINCLLLFVLFAFIHRYLQSLENESSPRYSILRSITFSFISYAILLFIFGFIEAIYRHSQWGLDVVNTINLDLFKLLSILTFLAFGLAIYYVLEWIHRWQSSNIKAPLIFVRDQTFGVILFIVFAWAIKAPFSWVTVVGFTLNVLVYFLKLNIYKPKFSFISFIYLFLIVSSVSMVAAWSTFHMENIKKANEQNRFANRVLSDNDVLAEYLLSQMHESMLTDKQIQYQFLLPLTPYYQVANKLEKYYLTDYFEKFEKKISIYDGKGNALYPSGAISFSKNLPMEQLNSSNLKAGDFLYLLHGNNDIKSSNKYVFLFDVKLSEYVLATICLELIPKKVQPDNVFPELLVDKRFIPDIQEVPYNYAFYSDDTLRYQVGKVSFEESLSKMPVQESFINYEDNQPVNYKLNFISSQRNTVVIAVSEDELLSLFSRFSYFFIVCFTLLALFSVYFFTKAYFQGVSIGLSAKIQLFFALAFLVPLISISVSTISFVNATFLQDIVKNYQERIERVGDHLTTAIMQFNEGVMSKEELNSELLNTTKIVNSDLNIYNLNGQKIFTSQPQIFEKNLLSNYINPSAFTAIKFQKKRLFTLEEQIGKLDYKTAYNAIYSYSTGELLAILASPFFKSSKEYDTLLSNLLTNVFNIFVASFIVFMLLAYAATSILTRPLTLLKDKLAKVNLSESNEELMWPIDDEIGLLIKEYNQMLLKLEKSKQALSRTEKESAWREMAQQVAHEIKNPLTPMKLSLQHLLMKMDSTGAYNKETVAKIKSILSQVDNLSDIATSFSSFAKMPIPENERTNVTEILLHVVSFFKAERHTIVLDIPEENIFAFVDRKILERIFNNMIINALQSEAADRQLSLSIKMDVLPTKVIISFIDNGSGIATDNLQKIFLPNFTTKEEGSGIGLAIAKRGIEYAGGKIWVESELDKGTCFYIELLKMD